jgi:hypothetical protein
MKHYAPGSFNMIDKDGKEYLLTVEQDDYTESPRDMYDNISTIYCWHKHYAIGDDKPKGKQHGTYLQICARNILIWKPTILTQLPKMI